MLDQPPGGVVLFLNRVAGYESANQAAFLLMPYLKLLASSRKVKW
jgi:hypothetical protein